MEYKVLILMPNILEETLNRLAEEGWRLVTITPEVMTIHDIIVVLERKKESSIQ